MITSTERIGSLQVQSEQSARRRWSVALGVMVLVVAVGWVAGVHKIQWTLHSPKEKEVKVPPVQATNTPSLPVAIAPPTPKGNDSSISKVPLPLILTGTLPGRNAHEGQAFIGVDKDSPQTYQAGAYLVNGARIAAIYRDHVVLEKNGHSVDLYLEGSGKHSNNKALQSLLMVGGDAPHEPAVANTREVLTEYIRTNPVYEREVLHGIQVYPGEKSGVFYQLGLQGGDVITSINGVPVNEPFTAFEQLKQVTEGVPISVTVQRKDAVKTLSLDGKLIVDDRERPAIANMPLGMPGPAP